MNLILSLWWKEYREQRPIWLAIAMLGAVPALALSLAPTGTFGEQDAVVRSSLIAIVLVLNATYAAVCGAMLLANDRENGTEPFLDAQPAGRGRLWSGKIGIGLLLVSSQTVIMFLLSLFIEIPHQLESRLGWLTLLLSLTLQCFAWSMCTATLTRTVLGAVALSVPLISGSWFIAIALAIVLRIRAEVWLVVPPVAGLLLSRYLYAIPDRQRLRLGSLAAAPAPSSSRVLLWLCWKQGRVQLLILGIGIIMLGNFLPSHGLWLWPVAMLAIGIICGVEVFAQDQAGDGCRFLGNQRFPPLKLWLFKSGFWLTAAILAALVLVMMGNISFDLQPGSNATRHGFAPHILPQVEPPYIFDNWAGLFFLILWLPYGFALGMLSAQLLRKQILALVVACGVSVLLLAPWLPPLAGGGLLLWQVLLIPAVAILASASLMRPWLAGRINTTRPRLLLALCGMATLGWLAASLWYRLAEMAL